MKLTSLMAQRSVCFCLALLVLVLPSLVLACWLSTIKRIERETDSNSRIFQSEILFGINKTAKLLLPISSSATNLAKIVGSDHSNNLTFSEIQRRIAPPLFQSLHVVPYVSQVSYMGLDGLFFSFYADGEQVLAVYANCSFSCDPSNPKGYKWFKQGVDRDTGKLYGEAVESQPLITPENASRIGETIVSTNGFTSLGTGWKEGRDLLLLNNAGVGVNGKVSGVVSLGFSVKELIGLFSSADFYSRGLYLATRDGTVLVKGLPNTRLLVANDLSFQFVSPKGPQTINNISCKPYYASPILNIQGTKYVLYCSPIEILGLQAVYALAFPLEIDVQNEGKFLFILLIAMLVTTVIFMFSFVLLMVRAAKRETSLGSSLIKQIEATEEAETKSMIKSSALAKASHDVRASLAGLIGLIDMSFEEVAAGSELEANLRQMDTCAKDLLGLLNSILDMSKIEAGKMELEEEEFDLAQLLEDVVDLFHPVGMKKNVDVILDPHDASVTKFSHVKGDRGKLRQILCNLLSNAVKFTSEGHISVRAWIEERSSSGNENKNETSNSNNAMQFVFEVEDTGKGIAVEERESVFENYVQVKGSAAGHGGTGLGLGIVQSLVRLMGGDIKIVDKENGGNGSCFRFNVLLAISPENANQGNDKSDVDTESKSEVVLLVQNEERRRMSRKFMESRGIRVSVVEQWEDLDSVLHKIKQKLSLAASSSFVLVVIDANAGPFLELCRAVAQFRKGLFRTCSCRVVWLEKPGMRSVHFKDLEEGMVDPSDMIVSKPFHGSRLLDAIKLLPEFGGSVSYSSENVTDLESKPRDSQKEIEEITSSTSNDKLLYGKRVLVAEDSLVLRKLAMTLVVRLGATVEGCENGDEALELVFNGSKDHQEHGDSELLPYDYILMDCEMPEMNGYEATRRIREAEKQYGVHIPIIALTAHTSEEETRKIMEAGMDFHLCKPLKAQNLLEAIQYIHSK